MSTLGLISQNSQRGIRMVAQLIDPDDTTCFDDLADRIRTAEVAGVDLLFVGGSLITRHPDFDAVTAIKEITSLPVVTFPSSPAQLHPKADAVLFLSLISGRNPEYLIGHHVAAAPLLRGMDVEVIPTGYMLVDCGSPTTAQYISHSMPLPYHKPEIAAATALAGKMLGLQLLYLDGGSGAEKPVDPSMVAAVKQWTGSPLVVGGGIRSTDQAEKLFNAGADVLVIGNGAWLKPALIPSICALKKSGKWKL